MPPGLHFQRCLQIVAQLNAEHNWELTSELQRRYAEQVAGYYEDVTGVSEAKLRSTLRYYHADHELVETLLDYGHPNHAERWREWTQHAVRILMSRSTGFHFADEAVVSLQDLTQEAMQDLWRGLRSFRYHSSFQTWAFTVVSNCLIRHYRALKTQKRGAHLQALSLDVMLTVGDAFGESTAPSIEEVTLGDALFTLSQQVLAQHPDRRLAIIFQLWACEDQTLTVIGDHLNLSPARVYALLNRAIMLLRNDPAVLDWNRQDLAKQLRVGKQDAEIRL